MASQLDHPSRRYRRLNDSELTAQFPGVWRNLEKPPEERALVLIKEIEKWGYDNRLWSSFDTMSSEDGPSRHDPGYRMATLLKMDTDPQLLVQLVRPDIARTYKKSDVAQDHWQNVEWTYDATMGSFNLFPFTLWKDDLKRWESYSASRNRTSNF